MQHMFEAVDKNRNLILSALDYIWAHPETGYREKLTSKYLEDAFEKLGYTIVRAGDIPGFYTVIDTGRPGPEVLVLGELDALLCPAHEDADPSTGAVHCCGHSAQCAALLGVAAALAQPEALSGLSGRIRLCAVPAEELIEIEYRSSLMADGTIKYFGGKPEFLRRGYFDGVDLAFMVHTAGGTEPFSEAGSVGCLAKRIVYKGLSAHAGGAPWNGRNALYAANIGLSAANAIRETFKENDIIRFHPIITQGGNAVNAIPDRTVIESYVRGRTYDAIRAANDRINRALCGGAAAIGTNVEIIDMPGYAPMLNDPEMLSLASDAAAIAMPGHTFLYSDTIGSGSTDMGDLSCIMPVVHPHAPGATGTGHGADYKIADPDLACIASAKWQLAMLSLLLENGAARAKKIVSEFKPLFPSKEAYFEYIDSLALSGDRLNYSDDKIEINLH